MSASAYPNNYSSFGPPTRSMGAGGTILLSARKFAGQDGRLYARGGGFHDITTRGPGAGGRIAVWIPFVPLEQLAALAGSGRRPRCDLAVELAHPDSEEVPIVAFDGFAGMACTRAGVLG